MRALAVLPTSETLEAITPSVPKYSFALSYEPPPLICSCYSNPRFSPHSIRHDAPHIHSHFNQCGKVASIIAPITSPIFFSLLRWFEQTYICVFVYSEQNDYKQ